MQDRYVGDIGDYLKIGILRALSPGYRLGVAWWLYPNEDHNKDGRHIDYLKQPERWRHYDPKLFDALGEIVSSGQRGVRVLEAANILPGTIFANDVIPQRKQAREEWFASTQSTLEGTNLVFVDPDNGLEPDGHSHGSGKSGKSILLSELSDLARPGRCLLVYHHQTRRAGGHHSEIEHWSHRLRGIGFTTVDALRAKPYSPRVFFLLDASAEVRQRAEQIAVHWTGLITWHPDQKMTDGDHLHSSSGKEPALGSADVPTKRSPASAGLTTLATVVPKKSRAARGRSTTRIGYVNRNDQEVIRPTGKPGTDYGQYIYVLRCRTCRYEYGANGSDIFQRRCPAHDGGAAGLAF
jgi:hypothetical protein